MKNTRRKPTCTVPHVWETMTFYVDRCKVCDKIENINEEGHFTTNGKHENADN